MGKIREEPNEPQNQPEAVMATCALIPSPSPGGEGSTPLPPGRGEGNREDTGVAADFVKPTAFSRRNRPQTDNAPAVGVDAPGSASSLLGNAAVPAGDYLTTGATAKSLWQARCCFRKPMRWRTARLLS
jgi:hypothetical protein